MIAGLDETEKTPYICSMDLIGCINFAKDFVVAGTASANLYGICESLFEPDLVILFYFILIILTLQEPDNLFEIVAQCLMNAVDRDALSGWGGEVTIM